MHYEIVLSDGNVTKTFMITNEDDLHDIYAAIRDTKWSIRVSEIDDKFSTVNDVRRELGLFE